MIKLAKKAIHNPYKLYAWVLTHIPVIGMKMSDKRYLSVLYRGVFGKKLNLDNPKTYSEKLQWLKLYDRRNIYSKMVDKIEVKQVVANIIGNEYIIPTIGTWDHFDEIDFDKLPNSFVLKCSHDSGGLVICPDKHKLDIKAAKKKIEKCLNKNFYWSGREWPYKDVKPRILAEEYMEDDDTHELRDYKFFAFDGVVKAMFIATERQSNNAETKFDFFDESFQHLPFTNGHPNAEVTPSKPINFELMKDLAKILSKGIPQVRIDFYEVNGKIYFGEITFSHWSGLVPFNPSIWDEIFGSWINLPLIEDDIRK